MLATIALSYWVISGELKAQRYAYEYQATDSLSAPSSNPQAKSFSLTVFTYYCLLIHVLVFLFPLRSCWAVFTIASTLRKTTRTKSLNHLKLAHGRRGSSTSLSSSETLTSSRDLSSTSSSESGDLDPDLFADGDIAPDRVIHAIVIPNYKEEHDTLRETLEVLASHPQARNTYDVSHGTRRHSCVLFRGSFLGGQEMEGVVDVVFVLSCRRADDRANQIAVRFTSPWKNANRMPMSRRLAS